VVLSLLTGRWRVKKGDLVVEEEKKKKKKRGVKLAKKVVSGYSATHNGGWWRGAPVVREERGDIFVLL